MSLGDGSRCDVTGIGIVKIAMFDEVVCTLGDVIYVSKMQRYLISLSQLDFKECRYSATGGTMKITWGCLILMKGKRCLNGLHCLSKSTMTNSIPLTSVDN